MTETALGRFAVRIRILLENPSSVNMCGRYIDDTYIRKNRKIFIINYGITRYKTGKEISSRKKQCINSIKFKINL